MIGKTNTYTGLEAELYDDMLVWWDADIAPWQTALSEFGRDIVDIGAGTGRIAIPLARADRRVFAVDCSMDMLLILRERLSFEDTAIKNSVVPILSDALSLPFSDSSHSLIIVTHNSIFQFNEDKFQQLLEETRRVLMPGGMLMLAVDTEWIRHRLSKVGIALRRHSLGTGRRILELDTHFFDRKTGYLRLLSLLVYFSRGIMPRISCRAFVEWRPLNNDIRCLGRRAGFRSVEFRPAYNTEKVVGEFIQLR